MKISELQYMCMTSQPVILVPHVLVYLLIKYDKEPRWQVKVFIKSVPMPVNGVFH